MWMIPGYSLTGPTISSIVTTYFGKSSLIARRFPNSRLIVSSVGEFVGNLNINCLVAFLCNKVNLSGGDNSYIYIKFLNEKMVAYNVLNDFFNAAKNIRHLVDDTVAKTMVAEVIFLNQLENTLTMYVISGELINNERIGYGLNILCCYIIGHLGTLRFEIFHYAVDRDKLSYIICKKENQVFPKI